VNLIGTARCSEWASIAPAIAGASISNKDSWNSFLTLPLAIASDLDRHRLPPTVLIVAINEQFRRFIDFWINSPNIRNYSKTDLKLIHILGFIHFHYQIVLNFHSPDRIQSQLNQQLPINPQYLAQFKVANLPLYVTRFMGAPFGHRMAVTSKRDSVYKSGISIHRSKLL